jgi:anti-sigma B factor antagonist
MSDQNDTVFYVNPYSDPILIRIEGRANFLNSGPVRDFFTRTIDQGKPRFLIDFRNCTGMDSTFLGILAGVALEVRRKGNHAYVILARLGTRNLELVQNLGLHKILQVQPDETDTDFSTASEGLTDHKRTQQENARMVLEAHESLVEADSGNQSKFQDLLSFLRNQVQEK